MKEKIIFGVIFSFLIIFTASFILEINSAEAREATAHCATIGKNKDRMIKISYDQATGTHVCETTLKHFGVDFTVPDRCGQIAELYLTDKSCQPPPVPPVPTHETFNAPPSGYYIPPPKIPTLLTLVPNIPTEGWIHGSLKTYDGLSISGEEIQIFTVSLDGKYYINIDKMITSSTGGFNYKISAPNYSEIQVTYPGSIKYELSSTKIPFQNISTTGGSAEIDNILLIVITIVIIIIIAALFRRKIRNRRINRNKPKIYPPSSPPPSSPPPSSPPPSSPPPSGPSRFARTTCKKCHAKLDPALTISIEGVQTCPLCLTVQ